MEEQLMEFGAELSPWGIYALDKDIVFLFGRLQVLGGSVRSLLLRSDDGGKHWHEVMQPEKASDVTKLAFVEDGDGWALVMWTVEGPGPACLYHTTDYGESWQKLSDIPFPGDHSRTFGMRFLDGQHGRVMVEPLGGDEGSCCILETADGGLTWNETGDCYGADECGWSGLRRQVTIWAQDGSQWRLEVQSSDVSRDLRRVVLSRRLSPGDTWAVVSSIPVYFEYSNGQLVAPGDGRVGQ
jgi:hypothetical protein